MFMLHIKNHSNVIMWFVLVFSINLTEFSSKLDNLCEKRFKYSENILQTFADTDYFEILLETLNLEMDVNESISNYIRRSKSQMFKIFIDTRNNEELNTNILDKIECFYLKKCSLEVYIFSVNYFKFIDDGNTTYIRKIFLYDKLLSVLIDKLFIFSKIFRIFFVCFSNFNYTYFRFMICDVKFSSEYVLNLPDKCLEFVTDTYAFSITASIFYTRIILSSKCYKNLNNLDNKTFYEEQMDYFNGIILKYQIEFYWRYEYPLNHDQNSYSFKIRKNYLLKIVSLEISKSLKNDKINITTYISIQDRFFSYENIFFYDLAKTRYKTLILLNDYRDNSEYIYFEYYFIGYDFRTKTAKYIFKSIFFEKKDKIILYVDENLKIVNILQYKDINNAYATINLENECIENIIANLFKWLIVKLFLPNLNFTQQIFINMLYENIFDL
ncbi:hypothetical protein CWI39_0010p0040 [Hamiltosporidium magnivora]|uniref:Uncharacterized protein n=1 Tax=Hamiltosporidium magnivora TaxID=148818 RepID=A0A4Q9LNK3_9MICR|nr:hypothetical protein CWI39_0010p0040 [Hamiltosporidium magnivora]